VVQVPFNKTSVNGMEIVELTKETFVLMVLLVNYHAIGNSDEAK
jgi:hypothetical protein